MISIISLGVYHVVSQLPPAFLFASKVFCLNSESSRMGNHQSKKTRADNDNELFNDFFFTFPRHRTYEKDVIFLHLPDCYKL